MAPPLPVAVLPLKVLLLRVNELELLRMAPPVRALFPANVLRVTEVDEPLTCSEYIAPPAVSLPVAPTALLFVNVVSRTTTTPPTWQIAPPPHWAPLLSNSLW